MFVISVTIKVSGPWHLINLQGLVLYKYTRQQLHIVWNMNMLTRYNYLFSRKSLLWMKHGDLNNWVWSERKKRIIWFFFLIIFKEFSCFTLHRFPAFSLRIPNHQFFNLFKFFHEFWVLPFVPFQLFCILCKNFDKVILSIDVLNLIS